MKTINSLWLGLLLGTSSLFPSKEVMLYSITKVPAQELIVVVMLARALVSLPPIWPTIVLRDSSGNRDPNWPGTITGHLPEPHDESR